MGQITTSRNATIGFENPIKIVAATVEEVTPIEHVVIDTKTFSTLSNHVPCSKLVKDTNDDLAHDIAIDINNLNVNVDAISVELSTTTNRSKKNSIVLNDISNVIKPLTNCKIVRFKGISTTNPASGILTIDGIKYVVSSDFDANNNGDVYYYHKTFTHDDGSTTAKLYAYVYSCGTFNHAEVPETEDGVEISGHFYLIGYGFYDNLSTNIHDDMVDDNAAIKMYKIDGLSSLTATFYSDIQFLSCRLSNDELIYDDQFLYLSANINDINNNLHLYYETKADHTADINRIDDNFNNYMLTSNVVTTIGDIVVKSAIKVPSTLTLLSKLENYSKTSHRHTTNEINDLEQWKENFRIVERTESDNTYVRLDNIYHGNMHSIDTSDTEMLTSNVPDLDIFRQLSNLIMERTLPDIGTLKFIATKHLTNDILIDSPTFDGWVFPDGSTITCDAQSFKKAKIAFGEDENATSFKVPDLRNFMKLNPGVYDSQNIAGTNKKDDVLFYKNFYNGLKTHTHGITLLGISDTGHSGKITASGTAPTGESAKDGGLAHYGGGTRKKDITLDISINSLSLAQSIAITGSLDVEGDDTETVPKHNVIPVLIYIGHGKGTIKPDTPIIKDVVVSFDYAGGTESEGPKVVLFSTPYGTLPTTTKAGFEFVGWFSAATNGNLIEEDTIVAKTTNHTLYAHWNQISTPVIFNADGGIITGESSKNVVYGQKYGTLPIATKENYIFIGWYTSLDGGVEITELTLVSNYNLHTLHAHYRIKQCTITLKKDGTGNGSVTGEGTYDYGSEVTIIATPDSNSEFVTWSNSEKIAKYTFVVRSDLTLTATFDTLIVTEDRRVQVKMSAFITESISIGVSGIVYVKDGNKIVGSGSYSGTYNQGFSQIISIKCVYPKADASKLVLTYSNVNPTGFNPTLEWA